MQCYQAEYDVNLESKNCLLVENNQFDWLYGRGRSVWIAVIRSTNKHSADLIFYEFIHNTFCIDNFFLYLTHTIIASSMRFDKKNLNVDQAYSLKYSATYA